MEEYILRLLESNNRVIVPDLGAFILRQKEPRELVFNDLLAFNDGMLSDLLQQEEGITGKQAAEKIESFVEEVKKVMEKGDPYVLKGVGLLTMDEGSRISFAVSPEEDQVIPAKAPVPPDEKAPAEEKDPGAVEGADEASGAEGAPAEAQPAGEDPGEVEGADEASGAERAPGSPEIQAEGPEKKAEAEDSHTGEEGFELDDQEQSVDLDASDEDQILEPDREEAPFTIDDSEVEDPVKSSRISTAAENSAASLDKEGPVDAQPEPSPSTEGREADQASEVLQTGETAAEEESTQTSETAAPEKETVQAREPFTETEPRTRQQSKPPAFDDIPRYRREEAMASGGRKNWSWIAGIGGLLILILLLGWFLFPQQRDWLLDRDQEVRIGTETGPEIPVGQDAMDRPTSAARPMEDPGDETSQEASVSPAAGTQPPDITETPSGQAEVPAATAGQRFYIVAGVFSRRNNAENMVAELRAEGYDPEIFGRRGNMYAVSYRSHASRAAALNDLMTIRREADPEAWLLQR